MARNFFNKKFSDYLGEQRALLDIITQFFGATPTPTATPFASPSPTPTATPTRTPSLSPTPTATVSPTRTPTVTQTPSVTPSPSQTNFPSPSTSPTPSVTPSLSPSVTPTRSVTPSPTPSATPSLTPFASPSATPSLTPTPSPSSTPNVGAFEFRIDTNLPGSNVFSFYLPLSGSGYSFQVNWGDGNLENYSGTLSDVLHVYSTPGSYKISITGTFPRLYFNNTGDCQKVTSLDRWGNIVWQSLEHGFDGCLNMVYAATDTPDLSACTSLAYLFRFNSSNGFNGTLSSWAVSNIQDISYMFAGCANFVETINNWDTTSVTKMQGTFQACFNFNSELTLWDTSNVTDMSYMFSGAEQFNYDLSSWDTSNVENFQWMFYKAAAFNQDIGNWNTSGIILDTSMDYMFSGALAFNQDLTLWCVLPIPSEPNNFSTGGCPLIDGNKPIWGTCPTIPSPTPSLTPTRTATPTPTPSMSISPTPSITRTPSATPSITPSITPYPICPEQLTYTNTSSTLYSGATGVYNRLYSYTGGTFSGGYWNNSTDIFTTGALSGNTYAVYGFVTGSTYWTMIWTLQTGGEQWTVRRGTGGFSIDGFDDELSTGFDNAITDGSIYYPPNGNVGTNQYLSYAIVCPSTTPTPSVTSSVTPTPSASPAAPSPSPTPTMTPTPSGSACIPWTPYQLSGVTSMWLDASDGTTLTISGADVTQWDDKSPNGNDAVGNSGNEPQTGATFNGLTTIEFNSQWFDLPDFALGADATVFMLANRDTTGSFQTIMALYNGTNSFTELWGSSGFPTDYMYYGVANQEIRGNTSLSDDTYYFTCIKRIYNSPTVYDLNLYLNGSADGTGQANDSNLFTDSLIGKDQYNSYFDGNIGEILVFDSALSDANRQKVEGYLAWKWGMEGDLPSGHPYKSSPPCV